MRFARIFVIAVIAVGAPGTTAHRSGDGKLVDCPWLSNGKNKWRKISKYCAYPLVRDVCRKTCNIRAKKLCKKLGRSSSKKCDAVKCCKWTEKQTEKHGGMCKPSDEGRPEGMCFPEVESPTPPPTPPPAPAPKTPRPTAPTPPTGRPSPTSCVCRDLDIVFSNGVCRRECGQYGTIFPTFSACCTANFMSHPECQKFDECPTEVPTYAPTPSPETPPTPPPNYPNNPTYSPSHPPIKYYSTVGN